MKTCRNCNMSRRTSAGFYCPIFDNYQPADMARDASSCMHYRIRPVLDLGQNMPGARGEE